MIPNPDYVDDPNVYLMPNIGGIGIEIWQVRAGSIFDNIFIGDSLDEAKEFSDRTFAARKEGEK
jgi:calreticulin